MRFRVLAVGAAWLSCTAAPGGERSNAPANLAGHGGSQGASLPPAATGTGGQAGRAAAGASPTSPVPPASPDAASTAAPVIAPRDAAAPDSLAPPLPAVDAGVANFQGVTPMWGEIIVMDKGAGDGFDDSCATTWNQTTGELFVTVCGINNLFRWRAGVTARNGWDVVRRGGINMDDMRGLAFAPGGALIVAERGLRRVTRSVMGYDKPLPIAERWPGGDGTAAGRLNGPYHVIVRRDGNIYFADGGTTTSVKELGFAGIYRIDPAGNLSLLVHDGWPRTGTTPFGLAFSTDQKTLFVSASHISGDQGIFKFPVNPDGTLGPRALFVAGKDAGGTGGLCTDQAGNVYHANNLNVGIGIRIFSPEGKLLGTIPIPTPTDCTFGDADFKTLFASAHTAPNEAGNFYRVRMNIPGTPE